MTLRVIDNARVTGNGDPFLVMANVHTHKCPTCYTIWEHDRELVKDNDAAHTCPRCGTFENVIHMKKVDVGYSLVEVHIRNYYGTFLPRLYTDKNSQYTIIIVD